MGATGSRSIPDLTTAVTPIEHYSKLMRAPVRRPPVLDMVRLDNLRWEVTVKPEGFNEETGVCDSLAVALFLGMEHSPKSARGVNLSIEILDDTGFYTVFHRESSTRGQYLRLLVRRSELEVSSCVRNDDSLVIRCSVKEQRRPWPSLLQNCWFSSKSKEQPPNDMSMSQTLPVDGLSKLKAALLPRECAHSKRFAAGGSTWYLKLYPWLAAVHLVRATQEDDDDTRTRAEVSFVLKGAVNVQSEIMTHTFDRDNPDCVFEYQPPEELQSTEDSLDVRCFVKVIPDSAADTIYHNRSIGTMGATGSRSSEMEWPKEISKYSKLVLAPVLRNPWDVFGFRDYWCAVSVTPVRNEETDFLYVGVHHSFIMSATSIEILDRTGKHTVFHRETSRGTPEEAGGFLSLCVRRSELEASSCVNVQNDSFLVRCTVQKRPRPTLVQNWFSSKSKKQPSWMIPEEVVMSTSHALTVDSLSKAKASLLSCECVYSTRFAVGGSRWYLKLSPALAVVRLVRATKEVDDDTMTRAELSFVLEGAVNVRSEIMTHTFDRDNPDCVFEYRRPPEELQSTEDSLDVRCFVKVIPDAAVVPTAAPPRGVIIIPPAVQSRIPAAAPPAESVLTPLLSAMDE